MAKKQKTQAPTEVQDVRTFRVSHAGIDGEQSPAIEIAVTARVLTDTREPIDYSADVRFAGPDGWQSIYTENQRNARHKKESACFDKASDAAKEYVYNKYGEALDNANGEATEKLNRLRNLMKDAMGLEKLRLRGRARVRFEILGGLDAILALRTVREHFPVADQNLNIAFRFRKPEDNKPWVSGKDFRGKPNALAAKVEKVASEKVETYREILGYAPSIMVTIDYATWRDSSDRRRQAILHNVLTRVHYNAEKSTFGLVNAQFVGSAETLEKFADVLSPNAKDLARSVLKGAALIGRQLDFFGLSAEECLTLSGGIEPAAKGKRPRVIEAAGAAAQQASAAAGA
jgi:hypothetical protein